MIESNDMGYYGNVECDLIWFIVKEPTFLSRYDPFPCISLTFQLISFQFKPPNPQLICFLKYQQSVESLKPVFSFQASTYLLFYRNWR